MSNNKTKSKSDLIKGKDGEFDFQISVNSLKLKEIPQSLLPKLN